MKCTRFLSLLACISIIVLCVYGVSNVNHKKPICKDCNIVFISLDTLSANHLPCYGYKRDTAPYLCSFATNNHLFTNMYANSNTTLPSHVSMLTGLYPSNHIVNLANVDVLSPLLPFLPKILHDHGYATHLAITLQDPSNLPIDKVFARGIDSISSVDHPRDWKKGLDKLSKNNAKGKKTFLFLHTYWTHSPYIREERKSMAFGEHKKDIPVPDTWSSLMACNPSFLTYLRDALKEDIDNDYWGGEEDTLYKEMYAELSKINKDDAFQAKNLCTNSRYNPALLLYFRSYYSYLLRSLDVTDSSEIIDLYDSKIRELDGYVEQTISRILDSDLKKNTIIIITSDHGEEFMEHGQWEHGKNLYDTSLKVPLMLYIPGYRGKSEYDSLAESVDILPTILSILNIPKPTGIDGKDLFSIQPKKTYGVAEKTIDSIKTIRNNRWKLHIRDKNEKDIPYELYDIARDPNEKNNVIFLYPDIVKELMDTLLDKKPR